MLAEPIRQRDSQPPHDAGTQMSLPWPPPLFMLPVLPFEARRAASVPLPPFVLVLPPLHHRDGGTSRLLTRLCQRVAGYAYRMHT
jgi:hypothetical protein